MTNARIVALAEAHFEPLYRVLDEVAREKRYLALTQAPPKDEAFAFFRGILENNQVHVVALVDGEVVGWCDVLPLFGEARRHVGVLGIGLLARARHRGIGARLMNAAVASAWARGLTRVELTVRVDNHNARALYERLGFRHEGIKRNAFLVDGRYCDSHAMALLREDCA